MEDSPFLNFDQMQKSMVLTQPSEPSLRMACQISFSLATASAFLNCMYWFGEHVAMAVALVPRIATSTTTSKPLTDRTAKDSSAPISTIIAPLYGAEESPPLLVNLRRLELMEVQKEPSDRMSNARAEGIVCRQLKIYYAISLAASETLVLCTISDESATAAYTPITNAVQNAVVMTTRVCVRPPINILSVKRRWRSVVHGAQIHNDMLRTSPINGMKTSKIPTIRKGAEVEQWTSMP